jgi:signal transduction histidine kinase/CheY-like chemotaxis protein
MTFGLRLTSCLTNASLSIDSVALESLFPAYILLDRNGQIAAAGPSLLTIIGEHLIGAPLLDCFEVEMIAPGGHPDSRAGGMQELILTTDGPRPVRLRGGVLERSEGTWLLVAHWPAFDAVTEFGPGDFGVADAAAELIVTMGRYAELLVEARSLAAALEEQKQAAEAASVAKSSFLATMSHEIRTPMNGVLGLASLLAETPLNDEQRELVGVIVSSGRALMNILNDVLDISKIEAGCSELESTDFDLADLVSKVHAMFSAQASTKGLEFEVEISPTKRTLVGDPGRLFQVLVNLVANAIKFTDEGRVVLKTRFAMKGEARGVLTFSVSDTGIGMSPASIDRIFQAFVQADSSMTRRFGGTGLGLAITRRLIDQMGGTIKVESRLGRGTTFRVEVPVRCARMTRNSVVPAHMEPEAIASFAGRELRLLVVEDNQTNQFVMQRFLDRLGLDADFAANGVEALLAWERSNYDLILMDIEMPVLDGLATAREIRRRELAKASGHTPIIALSADAITERGQQAIDCGMDGYLTKPLEIGRLARFVADAVDSRQPSERTVFRGC